MQSLRGTNAAMCSSREDTNAMAGGARWLAKKSGTGRTDVTSQRQGARKLIEDEVMNRKLGDLDVTINDK